MDANIQKWGNSLGIRLPKTLLDDVGLSNNDTVELTLNKKNQIIISKKISHSEITFQTLFKDWKGGQYEGGEFDWGEDDIVGKEIW